MTEAGELRIEMLARALCTADGNDPERMVTRLLSEVGRNMLSEWRFKDSDHGWIPAWKAYHGIACAALNHMDEQ